MFIIIKETTNKCTTTVYTCGMSEVGSGRTHALACPSSLSRSTLVVMCSTVRTWYLLRSGAKEYSAVLHIYLRRRAIPNSDKKVNVPRGNAEVSRMFGDCICSVSGDDRHRVGRGARKRACRGRGCTRI